MDIQYNPLHSPCCSCVLHSFYCYYSPKMYTSMAERYRYREVLAYTTVVILATYLFIMGAGYYYFAQFTLSPGKDFAMYTVCFCMVSTHILRFVMLCVEITRLRIDRIIFCSDDEHWKEPVIPDHKIWILSESRGCAGHCMQSTGKDLLYCDCYAVITLGLFIFHFYR